MLLGSLPMGRSVEVGPGRSVHLSPETLEEWAATAKLTPVVENHDPTKVLGWCTRVSFNRKQARALFWGELDGPDARRVARLVKARMFDGLSPHIRSHRGEVFYPYSGRWSDLTFGDARLERFHVCRDGARS